LSCEEFHVDSLISGEITVRQNLVVGNLIHFEVSDGRIYLDAKVNEHHGVLNCRMSRDPVLVKSILKDQDADIIHIGKIFELLLF